MASTSASAAALSQLLARQRLPAWRCAFGYGSGVIAQSNAVVTGTPPMVDVILCVDDPVAWHSANLASNASHYSWLGACGAAAVARVQESGAAGVYFNTLVPVAGGGADALMKYGVVAAARVDEDLRRWSSLYVAGRLHKPVVWVDEPDEAIAAARDANLRSAVGAALLTLPAAFDERRLFAAIGALSYAGDVRFVLGSEDPDKVEEMLKQRGEYRPHKEFGVNLSIPW